MQSQIFTGTTVLQELNAYVKVLEPSSVFVLTDSNTLQHCFPVLKESLDVESDLYQLSFTAGEPQKTLETCMTLWSTLQSKGADRRSLLINLGGGVTTDLGGFVASTFKRGIRFIQVPTSLLAMVDASVGGKTGVDFEGAKNEIGTFTEPEAVFIHPEFLETLPKDEMVSGWAEVLKHGLIDDENYWAQCRNGFENVDVLSAIKQSIAIKQAIVSRDLKESRLRKKLNFGHTIGHALESFFLNAGHPIKHGQAIAAGIMMAAKLSAHLSGLTQEELESIRSSIQLQFDALAFQADDIDRILELMKHDKKNVGGDFQFVLLEVIGKARIDVAVSVDQVRDVLHWYLNSMHQ